MELLFPFMSQWGIHDNQILGPAIHDVPPQRKHNDAKYCLGTLVVSVEWVSHSLEALIEQKCEGASTSLILSKRAEAPRSTNLQPALQWIILASSPLWKHKEFKHSLSLMSLLEYWKVALSTWKCFLDMQNNSTIKCFSFSFTDRINIS